MSAAVACAFHPEGWYDCGACGDAAKIVRHCDHPLKAPEFFEDTDYLSEPVNCQAHDLDPSAFEYLRINRLMGQGTLGLRDMDLCHFEAAEFAGAEIARMMRQNRKG